jgi:hypothetical protein
MKRRRSTAYAVLTGTLALVMGCSGGPEQQVLDDFFRAARMRDNTTLSNFATVSFDPRTDGVVQSFDVVDVGQERTRPLPLKQLADDLAAARAADEEFSKQKRAYQNDNLAVIDRVSKAQSAGRSVSGRDKAVADEWAKWSADANKHTKAISDANRQLNANRGVAELSLAREAAITDITSVDGEMVSKDLTINATVRAPDGTTSDKQMKAVLQRARVKDASGKETAGRWILTSLEPA